LRDILNGERNHLRDIPATELSIEPIARDGDHEATDGSLRIAG